MDDPSPSRPSRPNADAPQPEELLPEFRPRAMRQPVPPAFLGLLLMLVLLAFAGTAYVVWSTYDAPIGVTGGDHLSAGLLRGKAGQGTDPLAAPPPEIAPNTNIEMTPDEARRQNAEQPFFPKQLVAARPFSLPSTTAAADREQATTCLAAAAYYEAGNDPAGMAAVAQVVLNRVRHPAFPATVCGVVFQGAERRTGCQFTFTCDGALTRRPVPAIWQRARQAATLVLTGFVYSPVGQATHYHTDWVVPYWRSQLVKIAQVHTHLFYRWPGGWGEPAASRRNYAGGETIDPRIVSLMVPSEETPGTPTLPDPTVPTSTELAQAPAMPSVDLPAADLGGNSVRGYDPSQASFILQLTPGGFAGSYALIAYKLCKGRTPCRVAGWRDGANVPRDNRVTDQARRTATFLYERLGPGNETARWNCREVAREDTSQCIPGTS